MDDLISRQAAIEALYHVDEYNGRSVEAIRKLPSAQPEIINCDRCVATKRGECIWHNAGATYCSLGEVTECLD